MTIPFSTRKSGPYTAVAGQTVFDYDWPLLRAEDASVYRFRNAVQDLLVLDDDYSVQGVGSEIGGTITLLVGAEEDDKIVVQGDRPIERLTELQTQYAMTAGRLNPEFDANMIIIQEMRRATANALSTGIFTSAFDGRGLRLSNIADGTEPQDAVTYSQLQALVVGAINDFDLSGLDPIPEILAEDRMLIWDESAEALNQTTVGALFAGIPFEQAGTGAVARTMLDKVRERVSVLDFIPKALHASIADGTNVTDLATYIAAAWASVTSRNPMPALVFPAGVYRANVFPNFAVENATVVPEGSVRLRYLGTSDAVFLDGGLGAAGINNVTFGPFIIDCPRTGRDGLRVRNVHRSRIINPNVRGAALTGYGIRVLGCVCTTFDNPIVSANVEGGGWYNGGTGQATPFIGMYLGIADPGQLASYNTVINPRMEGVPFGVYFSAALGNVVIGGTAEVCSDTGVYFDTTSLWNVWYKGDFEANPVQDAVLLGRNNALIDCDTQHAITFPSGSLACKVQGGAHASVTVASGAEDAQLYDFLYNRLDTGGAVTDNGTRTQARNLLNFITKAYLAQTVSVAGTQTLTNKTIDASNNTISNLTTAMFAANVIDVDGALTANSDTRVASQKAVKTYADALIAANDAMVFKGVIDCSANPNYPAADRGHTYRVSVAGKIGGASGANVEAGDILICLTDATSAGNQATVGSAWNIVQANLDGAVIGPASATADMFAMFSGTTGKLLKDGTSALAKTALGYPTTTVANELLKASGTAGNMQQSGVLIGSTKKITGAQGVVITSIDAFGVYVDRRGTGSGNGEAWGFFLSDQAAGDGVGFGYSSSAYTTGGPFGWVDNSIAYLYYPTRFRVGTGVGAGFAMEFDGSNRICIGGATPTCKLDINDDHVRVRTAKTPASAAAAGTQGDIAWDSGFLYVCTATNTWKRVAIATW